MFDCYVYNLSDKKFSQNFHLNRPFVSSMPITPPLKKMWICAPGDGDLKISKVNTVSRDSFKHVLFKHKNQLK